MKTTTHFLFSSKTALSSAFHKFNIEINAEKLNKRHKSKV